MGRPGTLWDPVDQESDEEILKLERDPGVKHLPRRFGDTQEFYSFWKGVEKRGCGEGKSRTGGTYRHRLVTAAQQGLRTRDGHL